MHLKLVELSPDLEPNRGKFKKQSRVKMYLKIKKLSIIWEFYNSYFSLNLLSRRKIVIKEKFSYASFSPQSYKIFVIIQHFTSSMLAIHFRCDVIFLHAILQFL
jgi:hypothetical protein